MTDFRALCAELHAAFNTYAVNESHHGLLVRARTALAQPEPQGPTDEDVVAACPFDSFHEPAEYHGWWSAIEWMEQRYGRPAVEPVPVTERLPGLEVLRLDKEGFHYRGQFIADAGEAHRLMVEYLKQSIQPEPEVDDILRLAAIIREVDGGNRLGAAALAEAILSHRDSCWGRSAIEPMPVNERLPNPGDCDANGRCWWWHPDHKDEEFGDGWILLKSEWADGRHDADHSLIYTHWLPHWALPVPQQEAGQ